MIDRLEATLKRYNEIGEELSSPEIISDIKKMTLLSKERTSLEKTVEVYKEYKKVLSDIEEAKELLNDKDMASFAKEELAEAESKKSKLESELEILLIPHDPNDEKNVIVEIRGAAGGDEGNIFAGDLFDMYSKYAANNGWKIEILNATAGTAGGYSQIEFMVKGDSVYSKLKYESGAHRVQRVPATESQGRVHTSTATVLVMPEAEEFDFELDESEVRIDITRSSGCGGHLLQMRSALGLFGNLRPAKLHPQLAFACPLRPEIVEKPELSVRFKNRSNCFSGLRHCTQHGRCCPPGYIME